MAKKYKKLLAGYHAVQTQLVNMRVESSWVEEIGVASIEGDRLVLSVRFKDGTKIGYTWTDDNAVMEFWEMWTEAASKGKFLWATLFHNPYVYLI